MFEAGSSPASHSSHPSHTRVLLYLMRPPRPKSRCLILVIESWQVRRRFSGSESSSTTQININLQHSPEKRPPHHQPNRAQARQNDTVAILCCWAVQACQHKLSTWPPRSAPMATRVSLFQARQADAKGTISPYIPAPPRDYHCSFHYFAASDPASINCPPLYCCSLQISTSLTIPHYNVPPNRHSGLRPHAHTPPPAPPHPYRHHRPALNHRWRKHPGNHLHQHLPPLRDTRFSSLAETMALAPHPNRRVADHRVEAMYARGSGDGDRIAGYVDCLVD